MDNKKLSNTKACNRDVAGGKPEAKQDCSDIVNISIFFDGSGNNKFADETPKKWSNPARMWFAAFNHPNEFNNNYPIYVSGVGTEFNGTATNWIDSAEIKTEDHFSGNSFGGGATRRTKFGQDNMNDALKQVLFNGAKKLNATTKAYVEICKAKSLGDISEALRSYSLIKMINLSIFGFSRGAASARAFSNDFIAQCKSDKNGQLRFNTFPVCIRFMGLFDTVASFGMPTNNMDGVFKEKDLKVSKKVERCVHYVAAHELRFSFPVDLIRQNGQLMCDWIEEAYPGVHSDVGGGYELVDQGLRNNYARIPMRDMMDKAFDAGVRMLSYDAMGKLKKMEFAFSERFFIEPATEEAYKKYMAAVAPSGTMEQSIAAHMKAMYSAYGTMARGKMKLPGEVQVKSSVWETGGNFLVGHSTMAREADAFQDSSPDLSINPVNIRLGIPKILQTVGSVYAQSVRPEAWRLEAWNSTAKPDVLNFVKDWVHDSKAGFMYGVEPFSYFRPRGMAESSHNVLAQGLQWIDDGVDAIKRGVIKIYHGTEGVIVETWEKGKIVATRTYKVGEKFTVDTVHAGETYAVEVYQGTKEVVINTVDAGKKVIVSSAVYVEKKTVEAADAVQRTATSVAQKTADGARQAGDAIGRAADTGWTATKDAAGAAKDAVSSGASKMSNAISDALTSSSDKSLSAVSKTWNARQSNLGM